jgi:hypothetical protein
MVGARSEIRTVRKVVKQLPVEMLQHSNGRCRMWTHFMEEYYTGCQCSMQFVLVFHNVMLRLSCRVSGSVCVTLYLLSQESWLYMFSPN